MFFSIGEIIDIAIMSLAVGYIFSDLASRFRPVKDPLMEFAKGTFRYENFKFAVLATAPAVLLHELSHKFLAVSFGMSATFHATYLWLAVGVGLKLLNFPFIFFVPAFVSISGPGTVLQSSLVAFAGPTTNAVIWLVSYLLMKKTHFGKKHLSLLFLTSRINMFLFIFNMLPIPGFDGFSFFSGLAHIFFG